MNVRRWTEPVAYFKVEDHHGVHRVPLTMAAHADVQREAIDRAFQRRYGSRPARLALFTSDRWHLRRSQLDDWLWLARNERGVITFRNSVGTFSDFATTLTVAFDPSTADCLTALGSGDRSGGGTTVDSITWNALALTLQTAIAGPSSQPSRFGHRVGSANGSQNFVLTMSSTNTKPMMSIASWAGVDQGSPVSGFQTTSTTGTTTSWTVTSAAGDLVLGFAHYNTSGLTFTASDTEISTQTNNFVGVGSGAVFRDSGAASVTISWTHGNSQLWGFALSLKAAVSGLATRKALLGVGI